ncbi:Potassium transporter [Paramarasmius palmivorus]|uniref:Potassium transporter n=1 Tax=Paramarasmius palmivorus TaxID=297713 RepID=A0AAW0DEQ1_9AGAR
MCSGPKWKREIVPDHKFDFVDTREFTDNGFFMRLKYLWLYIIVLKSFLVYVSDIFTAITMLSTDSWSNQIFNQCADLKEKDTDCVAIPFETGKWLFVGCIIFSFLLLAYESRKARKIIVSRDISYAFTNVMANNYYSLRSYDHFCFFDHISNSTKTSDDFAFFVFFVFKSWKRLLLADGPRQTINALTLYAVYLAHTEDKDSNGDFIPWYDVSKYFRGNELSTSALTVTTFFTVVVFAGSLLLLIVAGICYVPLLIHIRGNLKEYCCHKVDKRISAVIKRRQKQRLADAAKLAQKEAAGDYSHLKNKKGEMIAKPLPQPTLPNLSVDDDFDDASSMHTRGPPASTYTQDQYYYNSDKSGYPPPMPAYNPYSTHQPPGSFPHFNPSQPSIGGHEESLYNYPQGRMYEDDNNSVANLTTGAAPFAHQHLGPVDRPGTAPPPMNNPYSPGPNAAFDPHDVYHGRDAATPDPTRRHSPQAYDDGRQGYSNQYHQEPGYPQQAYGHQEQSYHQQGYGQHASETTSYSQQGYDQYGAYHGYGDAYSTHDHQTQQPGRRGHDPGYGGGNGGYAM